MLRLKQKEDRTLGTCDASRCATPSTVIDGTHKLDKEDLEFCDPHMDVRNVQLFPERKSKVIDPVWADHTSVTKKG